MAWNGSGTFTRTNGTYTAGTVWANDEANGYNIESSRHDTHDFDLANGINNCLTKDGQNVPSGNLPMDGNRHTNVGVAVARTDYASAADIQDGSLLWGGEATTTSTNYDIIMTPAITTPVAGMRIQFKADSTSVASMTMSLNGGTAKAIVHQTGQAAIANSITDGLIADVIYDGTSFVLLNSPSSLVSYTPTITPSAGSASGLSVTFCRYKVTSELGSGTIYIRVAAYFSVSLSLDCDNVEMSLPFARSQSAIVPVMVNLNDGASNRVGCYALTSGTSVLLIRKELGAAIKSGTNTFAVLADYIY